MQLADDQVLVVAWITDLGRPVFGGVGGVGAQPRQVIVVALARRPVAGLAHLAELHLGPHPRGGRTVQAVELQPSPAQVLQDADLVKGQWGHIVFDQRLRAGERALLQGDVVVDELAKVGVDSREILGVPTAPSRPSTMVRPSALRCLTVLGVVGSRLPGFCSSRNMNP